MSTWIKHTALAFALGVTATVLSSLVLLALYTPEDPRDYEKALYGYGLIIHRYEGETVTDVFPAKGQTIIHNTNHHSVKVEVVLITKDGEELIEVSKTLGVGESWRLITTPKHVFRVYVNEVFQGVLQPQRKTLQTKFVEFRQLLPGWVR